MRRLLGWLAGRTYPAFLPSPATFSSPSGRNYLIDLWRDAPRRVAWAQTLMVCLLFFLPMLLRYRLAFFPYLKDAEKEDFLSRLMRSRFYFLRIFVYALKAQALCALLRDPAVRAEILGGVTKRDTFARVSPSVTPPRSQATRRQPTEADYVIIGSGAAGATAAAFLAEAGKDVLILEEGGFYRQPDFTEDMYGSLKTLYRSFGMQTANGRAVYPVLEGRCVGGTTVMNGAIVRRLPRAIHEEWCVREPVLRDALPFGELESHAGQIEAELEIKTNLETVLPNLAASDALHRLAWTHQAMTRAAGACRSSGRCMQGCPSGGKLSMEASYVPRALKAGAGLLDRHRAIHIDLSRHRARGVWVSDDKGKERFIRAGKAVIVAAGTVRSPSLLRLSDVKNSHLGRHFQCHLSVGVTALLSRPVREVEGPPQGIEVLEFEPQGIKLSTQLLPPELLLARAQVTGKALAELFRKSEFLSSWTGSVRSTSEGSVSAGASGGTRIHFDPSRQDLEKLRLAANYLSEILFQMGALSVYPGLSGAATEWKSREESKSVLALPLDPRFFLCGIGHIFGTCRLGAHRDRSVLGPDFRVWDTGNLYVIDASIFPTNTGTNPQLSIMTLARLAASKLG